MGVKERREREKADLRNQILDAARTLFARDGYEQVSMRKIAQEIEYSPTAIYLYFKNKEELIHCLCEETFTKLIEPLEALRNSATDPLDLLRKGLRTYIQFGLSNPNHYKITFMVEGNGREKECFQDEMGQQAFSYMRFGVSLAVESGLFKPVDIETTSQALWAAIHGLTSLLIVQPNIPWVDRDKLIDHLIDVLISGLHK